MTCACDPTRPRRPSRPRRPPAAAAAPPSDSSNPPLHAHHPTSEASPSAMRKDSGSRATTCLLPCNELPAAMPPCFGRKWDAWEDALHGHICPTLDVHDLNVIRMDDVGPGADSESEFKSKLEGRHRRLLCVPKSDPLYRCRADVRLELSYPQAST